MSHLGHPGSVSISAMRRPPGLIHFVLSLALVFNGISAADASTRMLLQHAGAGVSTTEAQVPGPGTASTVAPCHEASAKPVTKASAVSDKRHLAASDSGHYPDCCKAGACQCQCVHQSQGVIAIELLAEPQIVHASSDRVITPAHPEALLPHLIRPPIG